MEANFEDLFTDIRQLPNFISKAFIEKFEQSLDILERLYQKNKQWVVTYSGGKDSTVIAVLALYMKSIHKDLEINVTYSDTMMEIPQMSSVAYGFLGGLENIYDVGVTVVKPEVADTYWVRMLGRGYPPPGPRFRWCTPKIKIKPSRKVNKDEKLYITGMRIGESQQRDIRIKNSCMAGGANECGSDVWVNQKGIDVASPIIHWTADEVWYFLMFAAVKVIPEVKFVIDLYGNTAMRFGCWMCTVVMKDRTMEALSNSGDVKVRKLLEFREWIVTGSKKEENRYFRKDGRKGRLRIEFRYEILKRILRMENEIGIKLISLNEIGEIDNLIASGKYGDYA